MYVLLLEYDVKKSTTIWNYWKTLEGLKVTGNGICLKPQCKKWIWTRANISFFFKT